MKITANVAKNGIAFGSIGVIRNFIDFGWDQQVSIFYTEFGEGAIIICKNKYETNIFKSYRKFLKRLKIKTIVLED